MNVWGIPVRRHVHNYVSSWGSFPVDTVTNLAALRCFDVRLDIRPANDNRPREEVG